MLRNLKESYEEEFSPQRTRDFVFFTAQGDRFLFDRGEDIVIYAASTVRTLTPVFGVSCNLVTKPFIVAEAQGGISYIWKMQVDRKLLRPGFYDIQVQADIGNGRTVGGCCTFGYDVENMCAEVMRPGDFDAFWETSLKRLDDLELNALCGEKTVYTAGQIDDYNLAKASLVGDYDPAGHKYETVESYEVSFDSVGGVRIHGWFAKPVTEEKCRAMLVLPGAGFNHRSRPLEHARHGYAALDIQVHGQELDGAPHEPTQVSIDFGDTAWGQKHYYNDIYLHCVQAVNYLCSRGDIDDRHIVTVGGSQGGRLSLTTAALDSRVSAVVAGIVHYANRPYLHWAEERNRLAEDGCGQPFTAGEGKACESDLYYDVVNFASRITCPVFLNGGLIDRISPPEGVEAIYRALGGRENRLLWMANMGHDWSWRFDQEAWKWLEKIMER